MAASCSCTAPAPPLSTYIPPYFIVQHKANYKSSTFSAIKIFNPRPNGLRPLVNTAAFQLQLPAVCYNASMLQLHSAWLLDYSTAIVPSPHSRAPHFMMGGDRGTAQHLMQSSSIALFMVCACLQSLVYWRVMFWSTDRRRTLPMLHCLSAKWIPVPHLHITWHLNMCPLVEKMS